MDTIKKTMQLEECYVWQIIAQTRNQYGGLNDPEVMYTYMDEEEAKKVYSEIQNEYFLYDNAQMNKKIAYVDYTNKKAYEIQTVYIKDLN